jgi:Enoyl-CoA hydratase/isomerase
MQNHNLVDDFSPRQILVSRHPVLDNGGLPVNGLHSVWITLNNPRQLNSYTLDMVKEIILAVREASNDRAAVALVLTGAGTSAFCAGGNTREYAENYAGHPGEYRQYMRLFNDMVTAILTCDKPVICRVNGMRVGGGQEIGMACDFSVSSDLAIFSQAGPKHGSAPAVRRHRAGDVQRHAVPDVERSPVLLAGRSDADRSRVARRRQMAPQPARDHGSCHRRIRVPRFRRSEDRRGARRSKGIDRARND